MDDIIQSLVAEKLGAAPSVDPAAATGAAVAAATNAQDPATAAEQQKPQANPNPTAMEKATEAAEPTNEGKLDSYEFIEIEDDDGEVRQMTKQQIKSTLGRYRDLNHKWQTEHAPNKPIIAMTQKIVEAAKANGYEPKPGEVAELVQAAVKAYLANPTMGQQPKGQPSKDGQVQGEKPQAQQPMGEWDDEKLSAWERENAVSLPPGYKEQMRGMGEVKAALGQIMQLLSGAVPNAQQAAQAVQNAQADANNTKASVVKTAIKNNVAGSLAQQQIQLTPEVEQDFLIFSAQRGYAPEDFLDPELAATVAADYKANKDAPEVNRLREIAKRRQAFTGRVEGAPGGATGAPAAPTGGDPMFSAMVDSAMKR